MFTTMQSAVAGFILACCLVFLAVEGDGSPPDIAQRIAQSK